MLTIRRRPLGMSLILTGLTVAAVGSALAGLGAAQTAAFSALAALFFLHRFYGFQRKTRARVASTGTLIC